MIAEAEIEGDHGLPIDTVTIPDELQCVLAPVKARRKFKKITHNAAAEYFRIVVKRLNVYEEANDNQRNNTRTGLITISSLSHNRSNHSDKSITWIMFHNLAHMYRDITKQKTEKTSLLIQSLHVKFEPTKAAGMSPETTNVSIPLQSTMPLDPITVTIVPEDLEDIQPRPYQVWNCDEIGFDPNG